MRDKGLGIATALWLLAVAFPAFAQTTVFVVRHAERADQAEGGSVMMATDPDLSQAGRARAESLAAILKDAGVRTIFVTEYERTRQTAAPLAGALGLTPVQVEARATDELAQKVRAAAGPVLVVGHSNSVPSLLKALGIPDAIEIADTEYDNLFVVTLGDRPTVARLRYK